MAKRGKRAGQATIPGVAVYTRISDDAEGLRLGVERQRQDLEALAAELGQPIMGRFEDNDISASTRSTKRRPQYERMLASARAGDFGVIIAYTSSRLTRRPRENEDLIELSEQFGVTFRYLRSPSFDLNTADGRNIARILAANDAAEAERISERVARAALGRLQNNGYHGGPPAFGYTAIVNDAGKTESWQHHPEHAAWLKDAVERVINGESVYAICMDWRRQGRLTPNGKVWLPATLKRILLSPAVTGFRYVGEELLPAPWTQIVPVATWDRACSLIRVSSTEPGETPAPQYDTRRKHLLGGLLRCGVEGWASRWSPGREDNRASVTISVPPRSPGAAARSGSRWTRSTDG
jgi:site-specific DNA recombinase